MLFTDFLKAAVNLLMGTAASLIALTVLAANRLDDNLTLIVGGSWLIVATAIGVWVGRKRGPSRRMSRLLATAHTSTSLPEIRPARIFWNRLWVLAVLVVVCGALSWFAPQVAAAGSGLTLLLALTMRNQATAVTAVEDRDGVRFYLERTSPLKPMRVLRTPGWRRTMPEEP